MKKTYRFLLGALAVVAMASCNSGENKFVQKVDRDMMTVTIADGQKVFTKNKAHYEFDLYNPNDASFAISSLNFPTASAVNNITFSDLTFAVKQGSVGDGTTTGCGYDFKLSGTSTFPALSGYSLTDFNVYLGGLGYANASYALTLNNNIYVTGFATVQAYLTKTTVTDQTGAKPDYTTFGAKTNQVQVELSVEKRTADITIFQAKFAADQAATDIVYRNIPVDITDKNLMITSNTPIVPTKRYNNDLNAEPLPEFTADSFMVILNVGYSAEGRMQIKMGDKLLNASLLEFLPASAIN